MSEIQNLQARIDQTVNGNGTVLDKIKSLTDIKAKILTIQDSKSTEKESISQALEQVKEALEQLNTVTLATKDFKIAVPLKNLMSSSEVFKGLYESEMIDSQSNELFLNIDPEDANSFFSFLQTGKISLTTENAIPLFYVADQYAVEPLINRCCKFLRENTSWEKFPELLHTGIETNQKELIWIAVNLAMTDLNALAKKEFECEENFKEFSARTKGILKDLKEIATLKNPLIFYSYLGKVEVAEYSNRLSLLSSLSHMVPLSLKITSKISEEAVEKNIVLNSLDLTKILDIQDKDLEKISEIVKDLKRLFISGSKIKSILSGIKITSIPFKNLEVIFCTYCRFLTSLNASNAKKVNCDFCRSLTSLNLPNAKEVDCTGCKSLTSLNAPNATRINCNRCKSLTSLDLLKATEVSCFDCKFLTTLNAPNATKVDCSHCKSLISLNVLNAKEVECTQCESLTSLNAPNATRICCMLCTSLTTLDAPNATEVICGWTSLTTLNAPNATEVSCCSCTSLTILNAPNATSVDITGCRPDLVLNVPLNCQVIRR